MALGGARLLRQLGAAPGFDPPPGLSHPAKKSLASVLAEFIEDKQECGMAFDLLTRALCEKARQSIALANLVPWLLGLEDAANIKVEETKIDQAHSDCHSTAASESEDNGAAASIEPTYSGGLEAPTAQFRLRSSARPWLPQPPIMAAQQRAAAPHPWPSWPRMGYCSSADLPCNSHVSFLAETAAWTIEQATKGAHVHRLRERRGWSVIARVSQSDLDRCGELISAARRQVLHQTTTLPGTILLRSREKLMGFCISFGFVDDITKACWDMVQTGQCCRGHTCRWEHPKNTRRLFVAVKLASTDAKTGAANQEKGFEDEEEDDDEEVFV